MDNKLFFFLTIYLTALFASNLLGMKTMPFLFGTHLSVAVFFLPLLFITTDIVWQAYGKDMSKKFVFAGTIALTFFLLANTLSNIVPWSSATYERIGVAYDQIFSLSFRMGCASLFAFFFSEYIDVALFFFAKTFTENFFIRSTFSNIISQAVDTAIFMTIAFAGVFSWEKILMMSIPWWIYRILWGLVYTPFSYFILSQLKKIWSPHR